MNVSLPSSLVALFIYAFVVVSTGCSQADTSAESKAPPAANIKTASAVEGSDHPAKQAVAVEPAASAVATTQSQPDESSAVVSTATLDKELEAQLAQLRKLDQVRLEEDTPEARAEFIKVQKQILAAANKPLEHSGLAEETRLEIVSMKWYAALLLVKLGDEGAEDRFLALANELAKDKNPMLAKSARVQLQQLEIMRSSSDLLQGKSDSTDRLLQNLSSMFSEAGLRAGQLQIAQQAARVLEAVGKYDEAARVYSGISNAFGSSSDPQIAMQAEHVARHAGVRLGWVGKVAEAKGTRLDGQSFDLGELKGKVVLVDFWATWCQPCLIELPNVVENYKKYHDRGFEIVGVSLDSDKEHLARFVAGENALKEKLPWITLFWHEATAESDPYDNPLVKQYGVDGVPSTFLIDQEGKVIEIGMRGERLGEKLAELLGTPDDVAQRKSDASKTR